MSAFGVGPPQWRLGCFVVGFFFVQADLITLTGGPAPARAYIETLLPGVLDGAVDPGKVFDLEVALEDIPDAYRAMDDRTALKVLVRP